MVVVKYELYFWNVNIEIKIMGTKEFTMKRVILVFVSVDFIGGFDSQSAYEPPSKSSRLHMEPL